MIKTLKLTLVAALTGLSVLSAPAQAIFFSDQAAFLAANPGLTLQDFNALCPPGGTCPQTVFPGFTAAGDPTGSGVFVVGSGAFGATSAFLLDNSFGGFLNLTFGPDIAAVGFNVSGGNSATPPRNMTISLFDAANGLLASQTLATQSIANFSTFAGFSGVGTIDRVLITTNGNAELFASIDNLRFGTPTPGGVPEPASLALLGLGLAGLGAFRRKTKA